MLTGMGSLSYGELAGERIKLGLMLHDPEEEHDCFSDNTHNSHYYDQRGIMNVYLGTYERVDGSIVKGPSLSDLLAAKDTAVDADMKAKLEAAEAAAAAMVKRAERVEAYAPLLGGGTDEGNAAGEKVAKALTNQERTSATEGKGV